MASIKARWLASLSDGTTAIEGKPPFEEIAGEPSPWQKLLLHLARSKLEITGLRIQVEKEGEPVRTFNLPSKSPKQRWASLNPLIPTGFNYFRRVEQFMEPTQDGKLQPTQGRRFIEIHAYYPQFELVLIVDEDEGNECWVVVKEG